MSGAPLLADTHCHLMLAEFEPDRDAVLSRSTAAGVNRILLPGIDVESSRLAVALAETHPWLYAAVGVHPHHVGGWDGAALGELHELAASSRVVAIGEIGLDYFRELAPAADQRKALKDQLALAAELHLPIVVHNREAIGDLLDELENWAEGLGPQLRNRAGVLHAYSAGEAEARRAAGAGFYLGIAGPLTYPNAEDRRSITSRLPKERLVVETDSPYLTPVPHRGRRNEPANLRLIAERLAVVLDLNLREVAQLTSKNADTLFGWNDGTENRNLL